MNLLDVAIAGAQLHEEFRAFGAAERAITFHNHIAIASTSFVVDTRGLLFGHRLHDGFQQQVGCFDVFAL